MREFRREASKYEKLTLNLHCGMHIPIAVRSGVKLFSNENISQTSSVRQEMEMLLVLDLGSDCWRLDSRRNLHIF